MVLFLLSKLSSILSFASSQPSATSTRGTPMGIYLSAVALWFMAFALLLIGVSIRAWFADRSQGTSTILPRV